MTDQWDNKYLTSGTSGWMPQRWINNTPIPDDYQFPFFQQPLQGWQCPICGKVYAPFVLRCETKHRKPKKKADAK